MSVFFSFRDPELLHAKLGDIFAERCWSESGLKGHLNIGHGRVVLGHAHIGQGEEPFFRSKPVKAGSTKVRVISLARSGRKLKNTTESPAPI